MRLQAFVLCLGAWLDAVSAFVPPAKTIAFTSQSFGMARNVRRPWTATSDGIPINLDHDRASPVDPSVLKHTSHALSELWGDPAVSGNVAQTTSNGIESACEHVADAIGCSKHEVFFTSGSAESNNWAVQGAVTLAREKLQEHFTSSMGGGAMSWSSLYVDQMRPHVVCTAAGSDSVLAPLKWLGALDLCDFTIVPPDEEGRVSAAAVLEAMQSSTTLVSLPLASGSTGAVQPVGEIAKAVREWVDEFGERGKQGMSGGVLLHVDAASALGKIRVDVGALDADLVTLSGHAVRAPRGIGALFVRGGRVQDTLHSFVHGAGSSGQGGSVCPALAVAFGAGCALALEKGEDEERRQAGLVRSLVVQLEAKTAQAVTVIGPDLPAEPADGRPWPRLPNMVCVSFRGLSGQELQTKLQDRVAFSKLNADALVGAGLESGLVEGAVQLSVGSESTEEDVTAAADALAEVANELWSAA